MRTSGDVLSDSLPPIFSERGTLKNLKQEWLQAFVLPSTGQENNISQPKTEKWFSFPSHFFFVFGRLAVKCRFVAWQICWFCLVLINIVLLNLLCVWIIWNPFSKFDRKSMWHWKFFYHYFGKTCFMKVSLFNARNLHKCFVTLRAARCLKSRKPS